MCRHLLGPYYIGAGVEEERSSPWEVGVPALRIRGTSITLAQAVKVAGLAGSGGQAKHLVRGGAVSVNGAPELHPGRRLRVGDRLAVVERGEWLIAPEAPGRADAAGPGE